MISIIYLFRVANNELENFTLYIAVLFLEVIIEMSSKAISGAGNVV